MNFFKKRWEVFKAKSTLGKASDIFFALFILMLITSDGRIFFQRMILKTGFFGDFHQNESAQLSAETLAWQFETMDGEKYALQDFQGKVVFLNYWATWCPPCNAEMPSIIELMEEADGEVAFVFLTHEEKDKVQNHLEKKGWDIPVYFHKYAQPEEIGSRSLPTTFVINKTGQIIYRSEGMRNWSDDDARELLGLAND